MKRERGGEEPEAARRPPSRLPYEKPAVAWEEPLEARPSLMSMCQKLAGEGSDCSTEGPGAS